MPTGLVERSLEYERPAWISYATFHRPAMCSLLETLLLTIEFSFPNHLRLKTATHTMLSFTYRIPSREIRTKPSGNASLQGYAEFPTLQICSDLQIDVAFSICRMCIKNY